jgi:tol-pal system protein YbgF
MRVTPPFLSPSPDSRQSGRARGGGVRASLLAGFVALVALTGCATKRDVRDLAEEIRLLNTRQLELLRELQRDQRETRDSIRVLSSAQTNMRGELLRRTVDLQEDLLRLQEVTGISQQQLASLRDQLERERRSVPFGGGGFDEDGFGGSPDEIFEQSEAQYRRQLYTTARIGFEEFVERFPNHPRTPDARYYLGEMFAEDGDVAAAMDAFQRIAEFHPTSERVPEALLRLGLLHRDAGNRDEARRAFERVINSWPDSPAAPRAREALRSL